MAGARPHTSAFRSPSQQGVALCQCVFQRRPGAVVILGTGVDKLDNDVSQKLPQLLVRRGGGQVDERSAGAVIQWASSEGVTWSLDASTE